MIETTVGYVFIFLGSLFALIAAIGVYRLPGLLMKLHAATKAATLGVGCVLIGVILIAKDYSHMTEMFLLILFIAITSPISAHLLAKQWQQ